MIVWKERGVNGRLSYFFYVICRIDLDHAVFYDHSGFTNDNLRIPDLVRHLGLRQFKNRHIEVMFKCKQLSVGLFLDEDGVLQRVNRRSERLRAKNQEDRLWVKLWSWGIVTSTIVSGLGQCKKMVG